MRMRRGGAVVAAAAACLALVVALPGPALHADPTADEIKQQIADYEAEYARLTDAYATAATDIEVAQAQLDQTAAQLAQAEADVADLALQVSQFALLQWQEQGLNQSLVLLASADTTTLLGRMATVQQFDYQFAWLLRQYEDEKTNLAQLRATQEAAVTALTDGRAAMEQQMLDIQAKTVEARNLLATVVSPRDVGDNTGLTDHAIEVKGTLAGVFPTITTIGGYRAGDYGDHGSGLALDVMIPDWEGAGVELGDTIARWCQDNYRTLGIKYLIWRQRYWQAGWSPDSWQWMADRGSPTQNHYDHVHISLNY
jgi:hypothetical protein